MILPLPHEALLMRLEVGDVAPDFLALGLHPIQRGHPVRFDDGARYRRFNVNALRERHGLFDERIEIGFPIEHGNTSNVKATDISSAPPCGRRRVVWILLITSTEFWNLAAARSPSRGAKFSALR
jgi:hypothetical protein